MPELPRITAEQVIRVLAHFGFTTVRPVGQLYMLEKQNLLVTIPANKGKKLKAGTLLKIAEEAGIAAEDFEEQVRLSGG